MVAREYCESQVFERLCHMACLVTKSIGLHRLPSNWRGAMSQEDIERTELFWASVLDKNPYSISGRVNSTAEKTGTTRERHFFKGASMGHF